MRRVLTSVCLVSQLVQVASQANSPDIFDHDEFPEQVKVLCAVDVFQGVISLGQGGDALYWATTTCRNINEDSTADQKEICSLNVNYVLLSFAFAASYLSAAAADCAHTVNIQAYCSSDVSNLVADLANLAFCGSSLTQSCVKVPAFLEQKAKAQAEAAAAAFAGKERRLDPETMTELHEAMRQKHQNWRVSTSQDKEFEVDSVYREFKEVQASLKDKVRRLANSTDDTPLRKILRESVPKMKSFAEAAQRHLSKVSKKPATTPCPTTTTEAETTTTQAPLDVLQAQLLAANNFKVITADCVFNAAQAILYLMRASLALNVAVSDCLSPDVNLGPESGKMACSVDIVGFIGSMGWATSCISYTIAQCPNTGVVDALCAGDVAAVVASVAGIASSGASFTLTCGKWTHLQQVKQHLAEVGARLLSGFQSFGGFV